MKYRLNYSEFYITNVCDLSCPDCNRFNNYAFKGHHYWDNNKEAYSNWSKIVDIGTIGIIGGEPLLNPDIFKWIDGLVNLWPKSKIIIVTNGTRLNQLSNLYDKLLKYKGKVTLEISHHNPSTWVDALKNLELFLEQDIKKEIKIDKAWNECLTEEYSVGDYRYTDCNNIQARMLPSWQFGDSSLKYQNSEFTLHESNPEEAFKICIMKNCHHFMDGKLYKCAPIAVIPKFMEQYQVTVTENQKDLIDTYAPAEYNWSFEKLDKFMDNLITKSHIPQCSLCSSNPKVKTITASTKKVKIYPSLIVKK
jgi:organic radical activating enzyme